MRCKCGCGEITNGGEFAPGHDARHRSTLLNQWRTFADINARDELRDREWFYATDNRTFGVEVEFMLTDEWDERDLADHMSAEGINVTYEAYTHRTTPQWKIVTDASLRGAGRGLELVSPILKGKQGREELMQVMAVLNTAPVKINKSCGLHIHLGAENLRMKDLRTLFVHYYDHERLIDEMLPVSRREDNNIYCRSTGDITNILRQARTVRGALNMANRDFGIRYRKLNLMSYERHGTVEFRQHSGTTEATKILAWLDFAMAMVRIARYVEDDKITMLEAYDHSDLFDRLELDNDTKDLWMRWVSNRRTAAQRRAM